MYIEFFGTSSVFIWSSFQSPTHGGEELGHLVWVAQLAGGENPEQTLQTKLGQAAALVFPPCLLHRTGNVCVPPHQHAGTTFRQQSPPAAHSVTEKKTHEGEPKETSTLSCHKENGMSFLHFVHPDHLFVHFPPVAGSSAQLRLTHNVQILHWSEAQRGLPPCFGCCLFNAEKRKAIYLVKSHQGRIFYLKMFI